MEGHVTMHIMSQHIRLWGIPQDEYGIAAIEIDELHTTTVATVVRLRTNLSLTSLLSTAIIDCRQTAS